MKVVERSHYPSRLWERIKLSRNMAQAVRQIDDALLHWSEYVRHKCKARLIRIHQYLIRMRKMKLRARQQRIIPIQKKVERREVRREEKALIAAKLDNAIEKELLKRLQEGVYGEMYNFRKEAFNRVLDVQEEIDAERNGEMEVEDGIVEREYVADFNESDNDEGSDIEDTGASALDSSEDESMSVSDTESNVEGQSAKKLNHARKLMSARERSGRPVLEIEYEMDGPARRKAKQTLREAQ